MSDTAAVPRRGLQLALATISFAVCFAAWGLISAFAPRFREIYHLTAFETAMLVSVPVVLGALARIPMGLLTDRFGGRVTYTVLMLTAAVPVLALPHESSYGSLVATGLVLGLAGASFAVGVGFVSAWYSAERQGSALGVYGLGNIGQSIAVFLGPVVAISIGWEGAVNSVGGLLLVWAAIFAVLARNAPKRGQPKTFGAMVRVLTGNPLSWALSAFYFLTFGGFVAFAIYLPTLLKDQFGLTPADAGFRTADFVVLATFCRPVGGWLADRIGGARVLNGVFLGIVPFALLLAWPAMMPFTVGALGCASLLGFGNGAVFKLVPEYFPADTGSVTGLVGAMGGLGGFFPPLLLGAFRDGLGAVWPGYLLLAAASFGLYLLNAATFVPRQAALDLTLAPELRRTADRLRSGAWATLGHRPPHRAHRRRLAQLADVRSGARHLHVRGDLRHLGRAVSLQRLAREAADPRVLGARLAAVPSAGPADGRAEASRTHRPPDCGAAVHRPPIDEPVGHAHVPVVGLRLGRVDHVSVGLRVDPVQDAGRSVDLCHLSLRLSGDVVPARHAGRRAAVSRPGRIGGHRSRRDRSGALAPDEGQGSAGDAVVRARFLSADSAVRDFSDRPRADGIAGVAGREVLQLLGHRARHHGDRGPLVPAVRQVLPCLPTARATRREAVPAGRRGRRGRDMRALRSAIRVANAHRRPEARVAGARIRLPHARSRGDVAGPVPGVQAEVAVARAIETEVPWPSSQLASIGSPPSSGRI